jgi:NADPH2:quinone reductase
MPVKHLLKLPDTIADVQAAGMILKGLTAQYLLHRTYRVKPDDVVLVHAAAGGMGLILCQWAKHLGAVVIGTVSSEAKADQARAAGCHHPVIHGERDFRDVVKEVTDGEGCPVVYESIGKDTFERSLDCLRPLGIMASFGHASGPPPKVDVIDLGRRGSLFVTRPAIMHYMDRREDLDKSAQNLFETVAQGHVEITVNHRYPLNRAAGAHKAIENRQTTGSTVLIPFAED